MKSYCIRMFRVFYRTKQHNQIQNNMLVLNNDMRIGVDLNHLNFGLRCNTRYFWLRDIWLILISFSLFVCDIYIYIYNTQITNTQWGLNTSNNKLNEANIPKITLLIENMLKSDHFVIDGLGLQNKEVSLLCFLSFVENLSVCTCVLLFRSSDTDTGFFIFLNCQI